MPVYEMMVPTANTERYSFLLETNLGVGRPTFLAGASGTGKTLLAAHVSTRVPHHDHKLLTAGVVRGEI